MKFFLEHILVPLLMVFVSLLSALAIVASPAGWEMVYKAPEKMPVSAKEDGVTIAKHLWSERSYAEVSNELQGGRLNEREMKHYEDLQEKFRQVKILLWLGVPALALAFFWLRMRRVLWCSLTGYALLSTAVGIWAFTNWRHCFHTLHWWIFQDASWRLPMNSYSLKIYPYAVWHHVMIVMFLVILLIYLGLFSISYMRDLLRKSGKTRSSSGS